jgi:Mg-chelatase subunit ChlD
MCARILFRGGLSVLMACSVLMAYTAALNVLSIMPLTPAQAATANGELEGRAAPVALRRCVSGANAGNLCNSDASCPGSTCVDRNIFNISVAVHFDATNAQLTTIQNAISNMSAVLFDATDGQAEIGLATIHNNAFGSAADMRIYNTGAPCSSMCADTGNWKTGGSIHVPWNRLSGPTASAAPGEALAHEFIHLAFDARDEYETRPGCGTTTTSGFSCPDGAAIAVGQEACLMDDGGLNVGPPATELCWGQGNPSNLTDFSAGNHDATNVTEQSQCRSNRSCWAQVVWSYPNTILAPAGAPDPAANGLTVDPTQFTIADNTKRVVLVLDESGSMNNESPKRIERLKVAANDFVTLAENGTELGIVSYSDDAAAATGHANVSISALSAANRGTYTTAINGLSPGGWTNISDGLNKAKDMIDAAGGVTANTYIVLMSDGLNNRPSPQSTADAELQTSINNLLADGVEVYVTCTGSDLGLDSQCSEIATGTNGFYVDSTDAAQLPESFVDMQERTSVRQAIASDSGTLAKATTKTLFVEQGADSVTFVLMWESANAEADLALIDPNGGVHDTLPMPQGRFARINNPISGNWSMRVINRSHTNSRYVVRAYSRNQLMQMPTAVRFASVLPNEPLYVYAYPRYAGPISNSSKIITGIVTRPDGTTAEIQLKDSGWNADGTGDDLADDGVFTGMYTNTNLKGAYTFRLQQDVTGWMPSGDAAERNTNLAIPRFVREARLSAAVGDPTDVETNPEDGRVNGDVCDPCVACDQCVESDRLLKWLLIFTLLLLLLIILMIWRCCCRRKG